jgi:hypothetical protein
LNGRNHRNWRLVIRAGLIFGLIGGVLGLIVQLDSFFVGNQLEATGAAGFVGAILGVLVFGGVGRELARRTKDSGVGWRIGAIAAAVSELIRILVGSAVIAISPQGRAAFARLTPQAQQAASDPVAVVSALVLDVGLAIIFGALAGALGAWSALRFGVPPRD